VTTISPTVESSIGPAGALAWANAAVASAKTLAPAKNAALVLSFLICPSQDAERYGSASSAPPCRLRDNLDVAQGGWVLPAD
jgi:hypothetical protein